MEETLIKGLQLVMALSLLVVVHEFGHFIFARIFKVRVEKFYLFFNPWFELFKYKPKNSDTEYGIGWLPLGGYVKISGMVDESMDKEQLSQPAKPYEFRSKSAFARLMIMIGGVLFNFILAFMIYVGIAFHWGESYLPLQNMKDGMEYSTLLKNVGFEDGDIINKIDGVATPFFDVQTFGEAKEVEVIRDGKAMTIAIPNDMMTQIIGNGKNWLIKERIPFIVQDVPNGPAQRAGVMDNDKLVSINGVVTPSLDIAMETLNKNKGQTVDFEFLRSGSIVTLPIEISDAGKIGVALKPVDQIYDLVTTKYSFFESIPRGAEKAKNKLSSYVSSLKYIFTKEGAQSLGGFVSIANIFPAQWSWFAFWEMTAFLSIMLGFMNILPIPALDGGHVMFLLYEVITRRKPNEKFMEYMQIAGMLILFALLIFANGNDFYKMIFN